MMALQLDLSVQGELRYDEPLARYTSWRVGGPADIFFRPASIEDLAAFLRELDDEMPVFWLGAGSNLLVRDGGMRGVVIAAARAFRDLERVVDRNRAPLEALPELLALHQLEDEERLAIDLLEAVDGRDVGMVQGREQVGLTSEALQALTVLGQFGGEHLDGHLPVQVEVGGPIHLAHPSRAERGGHAVVRERGADQAGLP